MPLAQRHEVLMRASMTVGQHTEMTAHTGRLDLRLRLMIGVLAVVDDHALSRHNETVWYHIDVVLDSCDEPTLARQLECMEPHRLSAVRAVPTWLLPVSWSDLILPGLRGNST
jgi:hypothetical protein